MVIQFTKTMFTSVLNTYLFNPNGNRIFLLFIMDELLEEIESLRIDVDVESFGKSRMEIEKYQRANEMLDDCISIIRDFVNKRKL